MRLTLLATLFATVTCSAMTGGWTELNAEDPEYMTKAWQSVKGINDDASNNGPYHVMPIKVTKAKSQVVAGVNYEFEILVGDSTCKKGELTATELSAANCQLKENPNRALYKVTLWEKPWENFQQFNVEKIRTVASHEQI